jgi:DNA replication protein DnaC
MKRYHDEAQVREYNNVSEKKRNVIIEDEPEIYNIDDVTTFDAEATSNNFTKPNRKKFHNTLLKYQKQVDVDISSLNYKQKTAFKHACNRKNLLIIGEAGTGKSFVLRKIITALQMKGLSVYTTAMTGVAANNLDCGASTLHWWTGLGRDVSQNTY